MTTVLYSADSKMSTLKDMCTKIRFMAFLACLMVALVGCSQQGYRHPAWDSDNRNGTVSVRSGGSQFLVMVSNRLSRDLAKSQLELAEFLPALADSLTNEFLPLALAPGFRPFGSVADSVFLPLAMREKKKLDDKVFITTWLPAQHKTVVLPDQTTPDYLLLFHEINLGANLNSSTLYRYDQATTLRDEVPEELEKRLDLVISYTLWDNAKQRPLLHDIAEAHTDMPNPVQVKDIAALWQKAFAQIRNTLEG